MSKKIKVNGDDWHISGDQKELIISIYNRGCGIIHIQKQLKKQYKLDVNVAKISEKIHRMRKKTPKLFLNRNSKWTEEEDKELIDFCDKDEFGLCVLKEMNGRTLEAMKRRVKYLRNGKSPKLDRVVDDYISDKKGFVANNKTPGLSSDLSFTKPKYTRSIIYTTKKFYKIINGVSCKVIRISNGYIKCYRDSETNAPISEYVKEMVE